MSIGNWCLPLASMLSLCYQNPRTDQARGRTVNRGENQNPQTQVGLRQRGRERIALGHRLCPCTLGLGPVLPAPRDTVAGHGYLFSFLPSTQGCDLSRQRGLTVGTVY